MLIDSCFELGKIIKSHGTKGELTLHLLVEKPEHYIKKESVFIDINNKLVPFFMTKISLVTNSKAIIALDDVNTQPDAEELLNCVIYLPLTELTKLDQGHFYYHQVIGYQVIDKVLGELGVVAEILEMPGQDLIEMTYQGCEVLIPINDDIVFDANHELKTIHVALPQGLLEIYLTPIDQHQPDDAD
jgi:16S rRNA processing protein RimM